MLISILCLGITLKAQNYQATYLQVLKLSTKADTVFASLVFNANESVYAFDKKTMDTVNEANTSSDDAIKINIKVSDDIGFVYHSNFLKKTLTNREMMFTEPVIVIDTMEQINWLIADTTKKIGDYTCKKASGTYRGRSYTVWFSDEIPVNSGPWKLNGLPGLILEGMDEDNIFTVNLIRIKATSQAVEKPSGSKTISQKEYVNKFKRKIENLSKYLSTTVKASEGFTVKTKPKFNVLEKSLFEN